MMDVLKLFNWSNTRDAVSQLELLLQCSVCGSTATDPQCLGRCDHFFCSGCVKKLENGTCPKCKIPAPPRDMKPDRIISGLVAASKDLKDILDGGQIIVGQGLEAPDFLPCTPERQIRPSMPLQDIITAKIPGNSSSKIPGPGMSSRKTSEHGNGETIKISKNLKPTPKSTGIKKRPIHKSSVTPMKSGINKSLIGSSKKLNVVPMTPESNKFPKAAHLSSQAISPGIPAIKKRNTKGETPLHVACLKGDKEKVFQLLGEGANPNTKDNAGWTPLHEVCSHGYEDIAEMLLCHGAMVDVPGGNNENPLHDAVIQGQLRLVKLLRAWGASDTTRNLYGHTPRTLAAECKSASELMAALDTPKDSNLQQPCLSTPAVDKLVLMGSGLSSNQTKKLDQLARLLRARQVSDYSKEVTHIVTDCTEGRVVHKQSLTYMMGVVSGKWILSYTWVEECLKEWKMVDVENHEVKGASASSATTAATTSRINTHSLRPGLFNGCHMFLWGSCCASKLSKKEVEGLVRAGGGVVLAREPNPESIPEAETTVPYHSGPDSPLARCSHFIIYADGNFEPQIKYDMAHVKSRPLSWLLLSIENWCLLPGLAATGKKSTTN